MKKFSIAMGLVVGLSAAHVGCGPKIKPGLQVKVLVDGNAAPGQRAKRIDLVFDRPMVADALLGKDLPASGPGTPPFHLEPAVAGTLRWKEDRRLSFEPTQPLPRSTAFTVTVPSGTRAPDGHGLLKDFEFQFETERLSVTTEFARDYRLPDPKRWAAFNQHLRLHFNQPVRKDDIARFCGFRSADDKITVAGAVVGTADGNADVVEVAPADALPGGKEWRFSCSTGLGGLEGPLTLKAREQALDFESANGSRPDGVMGFKTFGAFAVDKVEPSGQDVNPDESTLTIRFSTPPVLPPDGKTNPIKLTPKPRDLGDAPYVTGDALVMRVNGFEPHTEYTVTIAAGIHDAFGQTLAAPFSATFRTGAVTPGYTVETGSWAVEAARGVYVAWARNVGAIDVRVAAVTPEELFRLLPKLNWWDSDPVDLGELKIPFMEKTLRPRGNQNRWTQVVLDPKELLGKTAGRSRFYYIASRSPEVKEGGPVDDKGNTKPQNFAEVLLNTTNLGITSKLSGNSGLVWVTRLSDGTPQPGAEVVVRERGGSVLWRGLTNADGIVTMPGKAELLAKVPAPKKKTASREDGEGGEGNEDGEGGEDFGYQARLLVFARLGDDMTFVDPEHVGGFAAWNFGVPNSRMDKDEALRGFLHTDRGLYRPGDTVHLRGLARLLKLGGGLHVPAVHEVAVTIHDPRGQVLATTKVPLSRFGGFNLDHALPEAAPLGDYRVLAKLPHGTFSETFTVEEYRPATFEVKLTSKDKDVLAGRTLSLSGEGRYFYGAPVRSAGVTFRVHSRERFVDFPGFSEYAFDDDYRRRDNVRPYGEQAFISEETLKLDDKGHADLSVALPPEMFVSPSTLMVSATVQDETNQTVSANLTLPLHQSRYYLGIDAGGWMVPAKQAHVMKFVAVNTHGKQIASRVKYTVKRQSWSCAWERWGYQGSYRCDSREENVATASLDLTKDKPFEQSVTFPGPGEYFVMIEGSDADNTKIRASRELWVWGDGDSAWRVDDSGRFGIVSDKKEYRVGDVAKLIVKAPTAGATALVTIERDGVLSQRLLSNLAEGQAIEVPVTAAFAPNAYVSVLLARGRTGDGSRGLPRITMGVVNLPVSFADKRLKVELATDRADYRPGGPVAATVHVTDADGKPVRTEIALAAADEGVLSLIGFRTPDPMNTFFAPWGLSVKTTSQYERLAQVPAPDQERYATGGDSAGPPGTFRSRFRATAYWNPSLLTDANGNARVTFKAPDNLTAFRLMAVAADDGDRFGSGEKRFLVNKPLQILSALPRFASIGDRFEAAVMLTNETGRSGSARVSFFADGGVLADSERAGNATAAIHLDRTVTLTKGGRTRVAFPVEAKASGPARFRFAAVMGNENDGLEITLPFHYPTSTESLLISQGHTESSVKLPMTLPAGVLPGSAVVDISVDPDGLAGIEESLRHLIQYPYGCLEQTTSRLIPLVAVEELTRQLKLPDLDGDKLQRYIRIAVAKIYRHQTSNGGFGLWPGSEPEPYLTAFALWGLKLAGDAGHPIDKTAVDQGVEYLRRELGNKPHEGDHHNVLGELGGRAFALHVLALLNHPEPGAATALLEKADSLPRFGVAFLARALAVAVGPTHASVTGLLDRLKSSATARGEGSVVNERTDADLGWYMSSNLRTSAIVTDALVSLRPDDPEIPRLVTGLLDQRREEGSWYTTQDNLYALVALTNYAKARAGKNAAVKITRGDDTLLADRLAGKGASRVRHFELAVDTADARPLAITSTEGIVHYRVRLRFRRDHDHQPRVDKGIIIRRTFLDPETGVALEQVTEGQMVKVQVALDTIESRRHVALSDFLPAGLEPINTRFVTVPNNLPEDNKDWYRRLWVSYRELGDERVDAFVDWMYARSASFDYLARATTVGTFVVPSATVEEMYNPDVRGRTEMRTFTVVARP